MVVRLTTGAMNLVEVFPESLDFNFKVVIVDALSDTLPQGFQCHCGCGSAMSPFRDGENLRSGFI